MPLQLSKYCGGKSYQLKYLYNIFKWADKCDTFIDVCTGMGSVVLNLPESLKFGRIIANDKDQSIYNLWVHFKDPQLFANLKDRLLGTEYNLENHWKAKHLYAYYNKNTPLDFAWSTVVVHRFSRSAMPQNVFQRAGRLRGGQNECVNAWQSYQKRLDEIHLAIQNIEIRNEDILKIMDEFNKSNIFFYCDVPYPLNTRMKKLYRTEMSDAKHQKFLNLANESKAKIAISGRPNEMYEYNLIGWKVDSRDIVNNMSHKRKKVKCPEVVWTNFEWEK